MLATIQSRCQRFDFQNISAEIIGQQLEKILKDEKIEYENDLIIYLSRMANGSMRDAQSLLDQVIAYSGDSIGIAEVEELTGALEERLAAELINSLAEGSFSLVLDQVSMIEEKGADFSNIMKKRVRIFRDALIYDTSDNAKLLFRFTDKEILSDLSERYTHNEFVLFNDILSEALAKFRFVGDKRVFFEFTLYKISHSRELFSCEGKNPAPAASSAAPAVKNDKLPSPAASEEFSWKESVLKASSMTLAPVIEEAILKENKKGILYIGWEKEYFYNQGEKKIREITDAVHKIDPHKEFKLYHIKKKEHKYEVKEKKPKDHRISEKILDFKNTFDGEIVGQRRNKDV